MMGKQQGVSRIGILRLVLLLAILAVVGGRVPAAWAQAPISLTNGVGVTSTVQHNLFKDFFIVVPTGATLLTVSTTNASGDVDLYVRRDPGDHILPNDFNFDCHPGTNSGNETCQFPNPQPGTWFVSVLGFAQGTQSFTVTATYQTSGGTTTTTLTNGVPVNGTVQFDFFTDYSIQVPAGATHLTVTTTNATGDVDLYVRFGQLPVLDAYDCRPFIDGGNETCPDPINDPASVALLSNPQPGTWFISVYGFASGTQSFTVTATYQTGGPGPGPGTTTALTNGVPVSGTVAQGSFKDYSIVVPTGATQLTVTLTNLSGDVDLFVKFGAIPHPATPDCVSEDIGTANETCQFSNPQAGTWFISAFGFAAGTQSFTVTASFQVSGGGGGDASAFVTRLYQTVLLREPDAGGLAAHVQNIQQFGTVIPTVLNFFHSQEFLSQSLSDTQFLDRLYHTFLNRAPDQAGLTAYLALLQSGCRTRDTLIADLTSSTEFRALLPPITPADPRVPFVAELYAWILNRAPDQGGLNGYVSQLQRSTVLSTVLDGFLHSGEFRTPRRSASNYVSALYLVFPGRAPDCGGLAGWVAALNQQGDTDAARDQVAAQFVGSPEFQDKLNQLFPPPGSTVSITVSIVDSVPGTVTSSPAGITCPGTCTGNFASGTTVILTAAGTGGSTFGGWGGACASSGTNTTCTLSNVTSAKSVTAAFNGGGPPPSGISGVYSTTGTATATSACGNPPLSVPIQPAFNLTITQSGSTFTGSGTANITFSNTPIQATINLTNGTVGANNTLNGSFTLTINALGQSIPVTGTFTGSVSGNTLTINATGTLPANLMAPPGCGFNIALTGHK